MNHYYIADSMKGSFSAADLFGQVDALEGDVFRQVASRRTLRTRIGDTYYFAKIHFGVGWGEIVKNLLQARLPVVGARNEFEAINRLTAAGVPTMEVALYCEDGANPATRRSAIVTVSMEGTESLEHFQPESIQFKRRLIAEIATIARGMHEAGVNHRDFYLCHFLMKRDRSEPLLRIIDLHRAQLRAQVPERWRAKDLGGLLFSAFDKPLTRRDLYRFIRLYTGRPLRDAFRRDRRFWKKVARRAEKLYLQDHKTLPASIRALLYI